MGSEKRPEQPERMQELRDPKLPEIHAGQCGNRAEQHRNPSPAAPPSPGRRSTCWTGSPPPSPT